MSTIKGAEVSQKTEKRKRYTTASFIGRAEEVRNGKYTYGSAGIGGSQHLAGAQFKTAANIDIRHVPL